MSKDFAHLRRLIILIIVLIAVFSIGRTFFIPKDFGKYGHYRAGSVEENMSRPLNYAGSSACQLCHEKQYEEWLKNPHGRRVNCETCHGALIKHTEDPTTVKPFKPQGRNFCALCHSKNISRPKAFPQIDTELHYPKQSCLQCHDSHSLRLK